MPCKVKLNVKRIHCPNCNEALVRGRCGNIAAYVCSYCKGIWISFDDLENITLFQTEEIKIENILTDVEQSTDDYGEQNCPECNEHILQRFSFHGSEFLFCSGCKGLYFDNDELDMIKNVINENANVLLDKQHNKKLMSLFSCLFSDDPNH